MDVVTILRKAHLLTSGVLAFGFERGWIDKKAIIAFANSKFEDGDVCVEFAELATCDGLEPNSILDLLRRCTSSSETTEHIARIWMFGFLKALSGEKIDPEEKLNRLEEIYGMFGYPDEMRECSRYYTPPKDRGRLQVGMKTDCPIKAMATLIVSLQRTLLKENKKKWKNVS